MFERFTVQAREVVVDAQVQARALGHRYIGTEHLLLALIAAEGSLPATVLRGAGFDFARAQAEVRRLTQSAPLGEADEQALKAIGIDLGAVRAKLEESFGPGVLDAPSRQPQRRLRRDAGHVPFTPRTKKVLELALREAIRLRTKEIRSEHLLLGLLREGEGLAAQMLVNGGAELRDLRARIEAMMREAA